MVMVNEMSELKLGTKIRILDAGQQPPFMYAGDIGVVVEWQAAKSFGYWADFSNLGNPCVYGGGIWCAGVPDVDFEILEESV